MTPKPGERQFHSCGGNEMGVTPQTARATNGRSTYDRFADQTYFPDVRSALKALVNYVRISAKLCGGTIPASHGRSLTGLRHSSSAARIGTVKVQRSASRHSRCWSKHSCPSHRMVAMTEVLDNSAEQDVMHVVEEVGNHDRNNVSA